MTRWRLPPMTMFHTLTLPREPTVVAPDGSDVRVLLALKGGSMAHFQLQPGRTSAAVRHKSVEEIWYVLTGHGEMWRQKGDVASVTALVPGTCLTLPVGVAFQFRCTGAEPLSAVAVTLPPWPGADEAVAVTGPWTPG